jgi:hypothetical protein
MHSPCKLEKGIVTEKGLDWVFFNLGYFYASQGKLDEAQKMRALVSRKSGNNESKCDKRVPLNRLPRIRLIAKEI